MMLKWSLSDEPFLQLTTLSDLQNASNVFQYDVTIWFHWYARSLAPPQHVWKVQRNGKVDVIPWLKASTCHSPWAIKWNWSRRKRQSRPNKAQHVKPVAADGTWEQLTRGWSLLSVGITRFALVHGLFSKAWLDLGSWILMVKLVFVNTLWHRAANGTATGPYTSDWILNSTCLYYNLFTPGVSHGGSIAVSHSIKA